MHRAALAFLVLFPAVALGQAFTPPCELPFADIAEERDIDSRCDLDGNGSASTQLQNEAKNNYCAPGEPALVTFFSFRQLQRGRRRRRSWAELHRSVEP